MNNNNVNDTEKIKKWVEVSPLGRAIGSDAALKLLLKYRLHLEGCVGSLFGHMDKGDLDGIRDVAHSLKGSGKSYGMDFITQVGLSLSSRAKEKDIQGLRELIEKLDNWVEHSFPGDLM